MSKNKTYIYALTYEDFLDAQSLEDGPDEIAFYIGSSDNPEERFKQHKYKSRTGHEDKYQFIRELEKAGKSWHYVVLKTIDESDDRPWEYWFVIDHIRKGSPLKNMRYGNLTRRLDAKLRQLAEDKSIRNVRDLQKALSKKPESVDYSASLKIQKKAILKSLRYLRTETDPDDDKKRWNIYDLGEGTDEIRAEYYMKKAEIAALLLPSIHIPLVKIAKMMQEK